MNNYKSKRLVVHKCSKCGKVTVVFTNQDSISCTCGYIVNFVDKQLRNGGYTCPNCGKKAYFKVLGDIKEINCNCCNSYIDLHWHTKHQRFENL